MKTELVENQLAVRVSGVSLASGISDAEWTEIEALWNRHHALIFNETDEIPIDAQVDFLERFGSAIEERIPGEKHSYVSNALGKGTDDMNAGYREGELTPHMDYTYTSYPADAISLYAEELPEGGAQTTFYSNVAPLERMSKALREELSGYTIFCAHDLAEMKPDARLYREGRTRADAPTQSHVWPIVRPHPRKPGVEVLFASMQQTERVIELSDDDYGDRESYGLLDRLFNDYLYAAENRYIHEWAVGDLVVWDNLALQHARSACPAARGNRSFRRVAVCEAGNAIQETVEFLDVADSSVTFS